MRLDKYLSEKFGSRTKAAAAINAGLVLINGKKASPSCEFREEDDLQIPHPEYFKRAFVIEPLKEIAPDFVCPVLHKKVKELQ